MPVEKSAGAIIFRKEFFDSAYGKEDKIFYLLLRYPSKKKEYWGFAKGGIEAGEKLEETARREIREETGLIDVRFIDGFKVWEKYFFKRGDQNIFKIVTFLLAETKTKDVKISFEHLDYRWLPYEEAFKRLAYKNAKEFLKKANEFISEKSI